MLIVLFYVLFMLIVLFYVLFMLIVLFYVLFVCKCVLYRVSTQFQLTNVSYHNVRWFVQIMKLFITSFSAPPCCSSRCRNPDYFLPQFIPKYPYELLFVLR